MRLWNRFVNETYLCPFDAGRIVFILRKIGTGSSGRVTQVFALSPATRPVPYFKQHSFVFLEPVQEVSRVASQLRVKWNTHGSCVLPVHGKPFDLFWLLTCWFFMVWYICKGHKKPTWQQVGCFDTLVVVQTYRAFFKNAFLLPFITSSII